MQEPDYYKNAFSDEDVEKLRKNPNVRWVNTTTIKFTDEFREHFYQQRCAGKPVRQIFMEADLDPDLLGERRLEHFRYRVKKRYGPGPDTAADNRKKTDVPKKAPAKVSQSEEKVRQLEHQVAYMQQEIEFLKKLQMANMEARKEWESKHRRK